MSDVFGRLSSLADLASLGGDALIEVLAGVIDAIGTGTEFTGEQLDRMGELLQTGADKVREMKGSAGPQGSGQSGTSS